MPRDTVVTDLQHVLMRRPIIVPCIEALPAKRLCATINARLWTASVCAGIGNGWDCELVIRKSVWLYGALAPEHTSSASENYRAIQPVLRFCRPLGNHPGSILFAEAAYRHPLHHDQRQANLTMGYARRLGAAYLLFANMFLSYPEAILCGGGLNWHSNRFVVDCGLFAGADRGRGVPLDCQIGYRIRLWRTVFLEARERATSRRQTTVTQWPVHDQYGNTTRIDTHAETEWRMHQETESFFGIIF